VLSRLWAELANRRVLRTAGVYLGTTLLILRLAERLGPMFGAGDKFQQLLSLALTMGFPVAVVLAWRYGRAGDPVLRVRYLDGLRKAGMEG
jgi:hypothetical protein